MSVGAYYKKFNTCPQFFVIANPYEANGNEPTNGFFMDDNNYFHKINQREYDENLEITDETYACTLYSSDVLYRNYSVPVEINYTKRTIVINGQNHYSTNESMQNYINNFDFSKKK